MNPPRLEEAFRRLQAGDAAGALQLALAAAAAQPGNGRAHLARGLALRALGRASAAHEAFDTAARLAPADHAPPYELGVLLESQGRIDEAIAHYERAAALRREFAAAHFAAGLLRYRKGEWAAAAERFEAVLAAQPESIEAHVNLAQSLGELERYEEAIAMAERAIRLAPDAANPRYALGWLLGRMGQRDDADARFEEALARDPRHLDARIALGRAAVARGDFAAAAQRYADALAIAPAHPDLPLYTAQALLLAGRWREAWHPYYARRDSRIAHEALAAAGGRPYRVPAREDLRRRDVALIGEQGLGDILFFLRFAPRLRALDARLAFAGDRRLHGILARTGLFDAVAEAAPPDALPLLVGDLPLALDAGDDVFAPSLRAAPLAERVEAAQAELASAGPRPWIASAWRSGTPREASRTALSKTVPVAELLAALRGMPGTVLALQRGLREDELARASEALGRPVHDLSGWSEDPEDALAVASIVDRHIGVSSTNMHLAALAGATADVLVPYPAEWRWRAAGGSPWFPGFRVLRQENDGRWNAALAALGG
ncbi:MAG TPA: tetratricopeptide repeat protein [Usitatibacter sp.]|nr:tetratricopeptide repeat protein [Usitatibacter sp.]